ncbi:MAG: FKBP-type peptidyl-prolyl cis-trans isomerase [Bacteroidales bacterium]|nr:FKBP-type peptidyl-prolyl cis-trans isomerase [Bacteroidales bacterium]
MIITNDKVVSLSYELKVNDEIVDNAVAEHPLEFLYGHRQLLPLFEEKIKGLKIGDTFNFMVPCDEGYGQINEMAVVELPKDIFIIDGQIPEDLLEIGRSLPMRDNEGNALNGIIVDIKDDLVVMDFNHPLAGQDLYFNGKVEAIRDASAEELAHGHIHGHHHHDNASGCEAGCCDNEEEKGNQDCGCGCGCN